MTTATDLGGGVPHLEGPDLNISEARARCSLWWRRVPELPGCRVGCIGNLAAVECSIEPALDLACEELQRQGCTLAIGPMDGSTWRSYRLVTESHCAQSFLFDVNNPPEWHGQFLRRGFKQIATYFSSAVAEVSTAARDMAEQEGRLEKLGIHIRSFDVKRFDSDLNILYRIASAAFADSFLYRSISWLEFLALYHPLRESVDPEFVLIAEQLGEPVGFIFAMPDLLQVRNGMVPDTVVIKTLGILKLCQGLGLGSVLVERVQGSAKQRGYKRAIHALMRSDNNSVQISAHSGQVIRRYGLFARRLAGEP
ncbi:MAG TPA: GNAT family N-acetyltransferase [Terriglobales bacterium]|nr:GNAT family N-acetyltransferase [Terriglobales bacterium]